MRQEERRSSLEQPGSPLASQALCCSLSTGSPRLCGGLPRTVGQVVLQKSTQQRGSGAIQPALHFHPLTMDRLCLLRVAKGEELPVLLIGTSLSSCHVHGGGGFFYFVPKATRAPAPTADEQLTAK